MKKDPAGILIYICLQEIINPMTNRKQVVTNFGLMMGLTGLLFSVALYATGNYNLGGGSMENVYVSIINLIVVITFPVLAINKVKSLENGFISFGRAFGTSFQVILISAIITAVWILVYTMVLETNYQDAMIEANYEQWNAQGLSESDMDNAVEMTKRFSTPVFMAVFTILTSAFFGALVSLIVAAILQKKDPNAI